MGFEVSILIAAAALIYVLWDRKNRKAAEDPPAVVFKDPVPTPRSLKVNLALDLVLILFNFYVTSGFYAVRYGGGKIYFYLYVAFFVGFYGLTCHELFLGQNEKLSRKLLGILNFLVGFITVAGTILFGSLANTQPG